MDPVFAIEVAVVGVAAVMVLVLAVRSVLRKRRDPDPDWAEEARAEEVQLRPGAGWGNGGSWH